MQAESGWPKEVAKGVVGWLIPRFLDWILPAVIAFGAAGLAWWQRMSPLYWIYAALVWIAVFLVIREYRTGRAFGQTWNTDRRKQSYTTRELMEGVRILAFGAGPHIYVTQGQAYSMGPFQLAVFNRLPFSVELESLSLELRIGDRLLGTWPSNDRQTIESRDIGVLSITYDLGDNQATMIRDYQLRARGDHCPLLRGSGKANVKSAAGTFTVGFGVEVRGFVYVPPDGG